MDQLSNRKLVKMIRLLWLLFAAVSLSWLTLDMMLDRPASVAGKSVRTQKSAENQSKPADSDEQKIDQPDAPANRPKDRQAISPFFKASNSAGLKTSSKENSPKTTSYSGIALDELERIDIRVIDDRLKEEQLAESLRNPAYLAGISFEEPGQTALDEEPESSEGTEDDQPTDRLDETDIGYNAIEEGSPSYSEDYVSEIGESQADESKPENRLNMTDAGSPVSFETVDYNEIEERILSSQLQESQINPAYLKASEEDPDSE